MDAAKQVRAFLRGLLTDGRMRKDATKWCTWQGGVNRSVLNAKFVCDGLRTLFPVSASGHTLSFWHAMR